VKHVTLSLCLIVFSCSGYAEFKFGVEAGVSNYSFLTLGQDTSRNDVVSGNLITKKETRASDSGHVYPAVGIWTRYSLNNSWQVGLSANYLGQPKLEHRVTYQTQNTSGQLVEREAVSKFEHHYSSVALLASYRVWEKTFFDVGYGHFFERYDGERTSLDIVNGTIYGFSQESVRYRNDKGRLSMGVTSQLQWFNRSDLQFRWQHIQSTYGPVQLFTLGLPL
jgi:hypothetical protein